MCNQTAKKMEAKIQIQVRKKIDISIKLPFYYKDKIVGTSLTRFWRVYSKKKEILTDQVLDAGRIDTMQFAGELLFKGIIPEDADLITGEEYREALGKFLDYIGEKAKEALEETTKPLKFTPEEKEYVQNQ